MKFWILLNTGHNNKTNEGAQITPALTGNTY
jgi:hypothetical protein